MLSLVLSILLVVLMFGAVLWVVDGERHKPTSGPPSPRPPGATRAEQATPATTVTFPRRRQQATSRRRPLTAPARVPLERPALVAVPAVAATSAATTVRPAGPPLPRHRARSSLLLVLLVLFVGALVALVIGVIVAVLAFALRSAVTS